MEKIIKKCPNCGSETKQWKMGFHRSKTQRYKCGVCGKTYAIEAKKREYSQETVDLAIKIFYSGVSGRGVGKILGMSKANVYNWIKKNKLPVDNSSRTGTG